MEHLNIRDFIYAFVKYVDLGGELTHRELGRALGEELRAEIFHNLEIYSSAGMRKDVSDKILNQLIATAERNFPNYIEELRGIAEGSAAKLEDILKFSFEEEIGGCKSIAVASGSRFILGHNEDWDLPMNLYIIRAKPEGKPGFISVGYAGQIPGTCASLNENGIAYSANSLDTEITFSGLPKIYLLRSLLEANSISDAESLMNLGGRTIGNNCLIASAREKRIASLEWSPDNYDIINGEKFLAHANHYLSPKMRKEQNKQTRASSENAFKRAEELLKRLKEPKIEDIKRILQDHKGYPDSICRHLKERGSTRTIASVMINSEDNAFYVSYGNPCENEYKKFSL